MRGVRRPPGTPQRARERVNDADGPVSAACAQNLRHPSLRAMKYDEARDIWQARVTRGWRFYFRIEGDTYTILSLIPHPK
jgi:hypothetical protein